MTEFIKYILVFESLSFLIFSSTCTAVDGFEKTFSPWQKKRAASPEISLESRPSAKEKLKKLKQGTETVRPSNSQTSGTSSATRRTIPETFFMPSRDAKDPANLHYSQTLPKNIKKETILKGLGASRPEKVTSVLHGQAPYKITKIIRDHNRGNYDTNAKKQVKNVNEPAKIEGNQSVTNSSVKTYLGKQRNGNDSYELDDGHALHKIIAKPAETENGTAGRVVTVYPTEVKESATDKLILNYPAKEEMKKNVEGETGDVSLSQIGIVPYKSLDSSGTPIRVNSLDEINLPAKDVKKALNETKVKTNREKKRDQFRPGQQYQ